MRISISKNISFSKRFLKRLYIDYIYIYLSFAHDAYPLFVHLVIEKDRIQSLLLSELTPVVFFGRPAILSRW